MRWGPGLSGPHDDNIYVPCSSGSNPEVRLLRRRRLGANQGRMKQNLCDHKQEPDNCLVFRCNNRIAVWSWPLYNF